MTNEDLIAADQNDTGAASTEEGEVVEATPSQSAADTLYPEKAEAAATEEQQPPEAAPAPGAPDKYELKLPEGAVIDQEFLGEFEGMAREANLNNEQAQKFAELGSKLSSQLVAKQAEVQAKQVEEWRSQSESDKEFGGDRLQENIAVAKAALDQFASPELVGLLNASGLGNHPEVIRAFFKVGKAISPDGGLVKGKAPVAKPSAKEVLYG